MSKFFQHDITHCNGNNCAVKEQCYRYLAYVDAQEKHLDYITMHLRKLPINNSKDCTLFWDISTDN